MEYGDLHQGLLDARQASYHLCYLSGSHNVFNGIVNGDLSPRGFQFSLSKSIQESFSVATKAL